jgi:hypothetical protein
MNFYYYLFVCAYWVSIKDLRESSAPQEYAFLFVSIIIGLLLLTIAFAVNLVVEHNILSGGVVFSGAASIMGVNYLIFLRNKRYLSVIDGFQDISNAAFKRRRIGVMIITFSVSAITAIVLAALNSSDIRNALL